MKKGRKYTKSDVAVILINDLCGRKLVHELSRRNYRYAKTGRTDN
jgi:hypothetical protein